MANKTVVSSTFLLKIAIGVYFIILGINGFNTNASIAGQLSNTIAKIFGDGQELFRYTIAILEILSGAVILLSCFAAISSKMFALAALIIFIFWAARMVLVYVLGNNLFEPNILTWLEHVCLDLVMLFGIWLLKE